MTVLNPLPYWQVNNIRVFAPDEYLLCCWNWTYGPTGTWDDSGARREGCSADPVDTRENDLSVGGKGGLGSKPKSKSLTTKRVIAQRDSWMSPFILLLVFHFIQASSRCFILVQNNLSWTGVGASASLGDGNTHVFLYLFLVPWSTVVLKQNRVFLAPKQFLAH